jgi:hypothetical protein
MGEPVVRFEIIGKDAETLHRYDSELFGVSSSRVVMASLGDR